MFGDEVVKFVHIEGRAAAVNECSDAVLFSLTLFIVVMVVMVVVMMPVLLLIVVIVVMVLVFVVIVIIVIVVVVVMMLVFVVIVVVMMVLLVLVVVIIVIIVTLVVVGLNAFNPTCRACNIVVIKEIGVKNLLKRHVAEVALYNLRLWLEGTDNRLDSLPFLRRNLGRLVQKHNVAELNLLNEKVLDVLLADVIHHEGVSAVELALHPHSVDHSHDAVKPCCAVFRVKPSKRRDAADGARNRLRFADAARLDYEVVELLHTGDFVNLLNQVALQGAADATVLKCHETLVLLSHNAALLDEVSINVHFAYVVDYHSETYSLFV